jgi:hypothetical protein
VTPSLTSICLSSSWSGWPRPCGWGTPSLAPGRSRPARAVPNRNQGAQFRPAREARPIRAAHRPVRRPHRRRPRVPALPGQRRPAPHRLGDLDPASLRTVRERLPGGDAGGDSPDGLALARRRTALLRSLCDAGRLTEAEAGLLQLTDLGCEFLDLPEAAQLGFVFAAWWEGVDWGDWAPQPELGRLLWHERDSLLQELAGLPPGQVDLVGFARRFRALVGHHWPSMVAVTDPADWRQALWATALAPLAMLGAIDVPARMSPSPAWFALTGTAPALVAAAAAMAGPEPPPSLAAAADN